MPLTLDTLRSAPDFFAVFDLPRGFPVDRAELEKRYLELARLSHPDLAGPEPEAQVEAIELSSRLNDAHRTLSDDESRANYLLDLLGGPTREQDKSLPEGFLPQIMLTREELAEAQVEADADRIIAIESDAQASRAAHLHEIARLFAAPIPDLAAIRTELNALRYFQRLLEQVHGSGEERM
jgi:molecular chaperone HscB